MNTSHDYRNDLAKLQESLHPPPASKKKAVEGDSIEHMLGERLGASLPDDYMAFSAAYGEVRFGVPGNSEVLRVFSPDHRLYFKAVMGLIEVYIELKMTEGPKYIPYPLHPERPGLLPWGQGSNRRAYFWYTEGKPDEWKVVYLTPEDKLVKTELPFLSFLIAVFDGKLDLGGNLDRKWFAANKASVACNRVK
jgi:hypothetical protein